MDDLELKVFCNLPEPATPEEHNQMLNDAPPVLFEPAAPHPDDLITLNATKEVAACYESCQGYKCTGCRFKGNIKDLINNKDSALSKYIKAMETVVEDAAKPGLMMRFGRDWEKTLTRGVDPGKSVYITPQGEHAELNRVLSIRYTVDMDLLRIQRSTLPPADRIGLEFGNEIYRLGADSRGHRYRSGIAPNFKMEAYILELFFLSYVGNFPQAKVQ